MLAPVARPLEIEEGKKPFVILVVGVNGSGKTTTIGKLCAKFSAEGKSLMLAAGDTFRAAAIEQLRIWGGRMNVPVIAREPGADAAGLAFDAIKAAQEQNVDILMMDTAGRLQNRTELMAELEKIIRVMKKVDPEAPHAVLLVLDATVGQNALSQVEIFGKVAGVTGLVMTKLDGTARGGILVAIADKFQLAGSFHRRRRTGRRPRTLHRPRFCPRHRRLRRRKRLRFFMSAEAAPKKMVNPLLKLVLEMGPLVLFFLANSRPALFQGLVGPFLPEGITPEKTADADFDRGADGVALSSR